MNTDFALVFLLGHLLGDFVFQTDKIAKMKSEEVRGIAHHSAVILFFQLILLAGFGLNGIIAAIVGAIIHFFIDYGKLVAGKYTRKINFFYFIFDQALHIFVIIGLSNLLKSDFLLNWNMTFYIKYLIALIFFTYVSTVICKTMLRDMFDAVRNSKFFLEKERTVDMLFSLILFLVFLKTSIMISFAIIICLFIFYVIIQKRLFWYNYKIGLIKAGFYIILGWIGAFVF